MSLYHKVINGEISALQAYTELYQAKKEIDEQLNGIKDLAVQERDRYGKENPVINGFQVEKMPGRKIWDYSGVSMWSATKDRLKDIEKHAQAVALKGVEVIDNETGEVIEPAKLTYASDTIKLVIPKQSFDKPF
jgi:hypothetical protein